MTRSLPWIPPTYAVDSRLQQIKHRLASTATNVEATLWFPLGHDRIKNRDRAKRCHTELALIKPAIFSNSHTQRSSNTVRRAMVVDRAKHPVQFRIAG